MRVSGFFLIVFIFCIISCGQGRNLSEEQTNFCEHSKGAWNENCSQYNKHVDKNVKEKLILVGCEGPGLGCGAFVSFYTKLNNQNCAKDLDRLYYNELWQFRDRKGNLTKIYWKDGIFIYMGSENPKKFSGGKVTFESSGKVLNVVEYMGRGRQWFLCEIR